MALTDSLDAATQQVLALLAQLKTSNVRFIQAQDNGSADNVTLNPTPTVGSYGPDLVILADIAAPNATNTPRLNVSSIGWLNITAADGTPVAIGAVAGKCLFGFSSAISGGYTARLLLSLPSSLTSGTGSAGAGISGYVPSGIAGTLTNATMTIGKGSAHDSTGATAIKMPAARTWSVTNGNAADGFQGGTTLPPNATLYMFAMSGTAGTATFASQSLTPTLPTGYTVFRLLFPFTTSGSGPVPFIAFEGDGGSLVCFLTTPKLDLNGYLVPSSARGLVALSVPLGVSVEWIGAAASAGANPSAMYVLRITSPFEPDLPLGPSLTGSVSGEPTAVPLPDEYGGNGGSTVGFDIKSRKFLTDTSGRLGIRSNYNASTFSLYLETDGWIYARRL